MGRLTRARSTIASRHYWAWSYYYAHKVKLLTKNRNKSAILIYFIAIIKLVRELLISKMHNKFEEDTWKTVQVIAPTMSKYWREMRKIAINRPFWFFSASIELVRELLEVCVRGVHRGRVRRVLTPPPPWAADFQKFLGSQNPYFSTFYLLPPPPPYRKAVDAPGCYGSEFRLQVIHCPIVLDYSQVWNYFKSFIKKKNQNDFIIWSLSPDYNGLVVPYCNSQ